MQPLWTDEPPNRVQWEWRRVKRSFGIENCKNLVEELQYWNTALKNCFEKPEVPAEDDDCKVQELQARFNPKHCDSIRDNIQALHGALKDSWNCGCPCSHHASIDLNWQSDLFSRLSEFDMAFSFWDTTLQGATAEPKWRKIRLIIEKTDLGNAVPVALPVPSQQASRTSPTPSTISRRERISHFLNQFQDKKPRLVPGAAPFDTGKIIIAFCSNFKRQR
jgi:hypothetical protein